MVDNAGIALDFQKNFHDQKAVKCMLNGTLGFTVTDMLAWLLKTTTTEFNSAYVYLKEFYAPQIVS